MEKNLEKNIYIHIYMCVYMYKITKSLFYTPETNTTT